MLCISACIARNLPHMRPLIRIICALLMLILPYRTLALKRMDGPIFRLHSVLDRNPTQSDPNAVQFGPGQQYRGPVLAPEERQHRRYQAHRLTIAGSLLIPAGAIVLLAGHAVHSQVNERGTTTGQLIMYSGVGLAAIGLSLIITSIILKYIYR